MTLWRCAGCQRAFARPPAVCRCGGADFRTVEASGRGRVYSCATVYAAAEAFQKDVPFQIAIVELEEGPRLTARIAGGEANIGDTVRLAGERDGVCSFSLAEH